MEAELRNKVTRFRESVSVIREMLEKDVLNAEEALVLQTKMAEKNGLSLSSIFLDNPLIYTDSDGNMTPIGGEKQNGTES